MERTRDNIFAVWRRVLNLSWPVVAEQAFRTLMRTTDIIVTGLFSPAAIVAIGLADRYAQIPLRIGLSLSSSSIAISSQDTGTGATATRNESITQGLILGFLLGLPFVIGGFLFGHLAIEILGAASNVVQLGGVYLAIIFATAPARHVYLVASRAFQGMGDTQTPMYVKLGTNVMNICLTVILGLGIGPAPQLGIVGVGLATAAGNVFNAVLLLVALVMRTTYSYERPTDLTITKQIMRIAVPKLGEGLSQTAADFPFNAILLILGTEVNAGYQIGRRAYQQLAAPFGRGFRTSASIVVGQTFNEKDLEEILFNGWMTVILGTILVSIIGTGLFIFSPSIARIFTNDPRTIMYAQGFIKAYAVGAPLYVFSRTLAGVLEGGSDTRAAFFARISGAFIMLVGATYLFAIVFSGGASAVYLTIIGMHAWTAVFLVIWVYKAAWISRGLTMMEERGSIE